MRRYTSSTPTKPALRAAAPENGAKGIEAILLNIYSILLPVRIFCSRMHSFGALLQWTGRYHMATEFESFRNVLQNQVDMMICLLILGLGTGRNYIPEEEKN